MLRPLRRILNPARRRARWSLKLALLLLLLGLVLYPNPVLLVRNIQHWSRLDQLPDPHDPALDDLAAALEPQLAGVTSDRQALAIVEAYVITRLPYAWDWETWGVADYVPTVAEAIDKGREDCDGQAVVAAALLRRHGYEAHLVTDGTHVWVWTPSGETMSPMRTASGRSVVSADEDGSHFDLLAIIDPRALLIDWPVSLAYGIHVFPLWRELVLVAGLWLCLLGVEPRRRREVAGGGGLVLALVLLRLAGGWERAIPAAALAWVGVIVVGVVLCWAWRSPRRRAETAASSRG